MNESLKKESEKLARSWMQHDAGWLRDYLVSGVEDPRMNVQSILSRHFLIQAIAGERFGRLMQQEYRFAAVMNWLLALTENISHAEEFGALLYGLRRGADNAEGIAIPRWAVRIFSGLPVRLDEAEVPNYIEGFLGGTRVIGGRLSPDQDALNTFCRVWARALRQEHGSPEARRFRVLEPACGSANDYRFLDAFGIATLMDYTGIDLCGRNIENARALFPAVCFETGNVFQIAYPDNAFDYCLVHDLFEHLSLEGLAAAVGEICRVTRAGICAGFFQMDEIPQHLVRPVDEYHWNLLSMSGMKELFARHGFEAQAVHIGTFLRDVTGCDQTHNPNAYTFLAERREER